MAIALVWLALSAAGVASDDDQDQQPPGLWAEYRDSRGVAVGRVDTELAFDWSGRRPDARLAPGPFTVRWSGYLEPEVPGAYRLYVHGTGNFQIRVNGTSILGAEAPRQQWIDSAVFQMDFDQQPIEIEYRGPVPLQPLAFFWSGPGFPLEPLGHRALVHDPPAELTDAFARGAALYEALRCAACHRLDGAAAVVPAPALDQLSKHLRRPWLLDWLTSPPPAKQTTVADVPRPMPHFALDRSDAAALADFLLGSEDEATAPAQPEDESRKVTPDQLAQGRDLLLSLGCLACHRLADLGQSPLFGGGDLSRIADKRPRGFFATWLAEPQRLNRDHRMPVFDLDDDQRAQLAAFLASLTGADMPVDAATNVSSTAAVPQAREGGGILFRQHRCDACHRAPQPDGPAAAADPGPARSAVPLNARSDWRDSCCDQPDSDRRPGYGLSEADREALRAYVQQVVADDPASNPNSDGEQLLRQHNCLACHDRNSSQGLSAQVPGIVERWPHLREMADQLVPPSLTTVGDKLHDTALREALQRSGVVRRPWLRVRMPRFALDEGQLETLVRYFRAVDRIPARNEPSRDAAELTAPVPPASELAWRLAGARLVTADGFGCVSCHAIGTVRPERTAPGTRGPALDDISRSIRRPWFDRLLGYPLRIARQMEMPSIQAPVRGVLDDRLPAQLDALWYVLSQPGFEPPPPDPVRTVRQTGDLSISARAIVLTDVLRTPRGSLTKPLLLGFGNRHNFVYDLGSANLVRWSVGDVAQQRTEGKSWYWQAVGGVLLDREAGPPELTLIDQGESLEPLRRGQFFTELDQWRHVPRGLEFEHRLWFTDRRGGVQTLRVRQRWVAWSEGDQRGARRWMSIAGCLPGQSLRLQLSPTAPPDTPHARNVLPLDPTAGTSIRLVQPADAQIDAQGQLVIPPPAVEAAADEAPRCVELLYASSTPTDKYLLPAPAAEPRPAESLQVVPGFRVTRLPLDEQLMPTALAWRPDGTLVVASLKGRVWLARDRDGDQLEDQLQPFSDELAAPYGLATGAGYVDVLHKPALLRLYDEDGDGQAERSETIASGWGHTDDYHDWAVGLPRDDDGNYYIALPCQQDDRQPAAAYLRGCIVQLVPQKPSSSDPRRFRLNPWAFGQRFPMGLALNHAGILVATDNQGNYNPFNELNQIVPGRHYGFINRLEQRPEYHPAITSPAINIPHPWTRSVNGICFLELPAGNSSEATGSMPFGPLAGQLVGCEYDTRRLIRMSLQEVNGQWQGAAYPLSVEAPEGEVTMLGPVCCAVSPAGALYVGSLRDSGWGGANNVGEILRMEFDPTQLPCGIREVTARAEGLRLEFTRPIDRDLAADRRRYAVESYFRISTPAYGGPDQQRRQVAVRDLRVSPDAMSVDLDLDRLEAGRVYEIRLKPLVPHGKFFPAEAYYTLNQKVAGTE